MVLFSEDLLLPDLKQKTLSLEVHKSKEVEVKNDDTAVNKSIPKHFKTNIEELNLLGENGEGEAEAFGFTPSTSSEFRIDTLNL